jgi:hypothetical protein
MNVVSRSRNAIVGPARHETQRAHVREELNTTSAIFFCLNHSLGENRGTAGRIGEVRLVVSRLEEYSSIRFP